MTAAFVGVELPDVDCLTADLTSVADQLIRLAEQHRATPAGARTLGQQALPTTRGLRIAGWLIGTCDARHAIAQLSLPALLGGPVGTAQRYGARGPDVLEALARRNLGLSATNDLYDYGMQIRREVHGDEHVDRAEAGHTPMTDDFQDYTTRTAWGMIWSRPGLDRRSRSVIILTALIAGHHYSELEFHLRATLRNGLTRAEITALILHSAATAAFRLPTPHSASPAASSAPRERAFDRELTASDRPVHGSYAVLPRRGSTSARR